MNYSCHGAKPSKENTDDSTCDISVSSLTPDADQHASLSNFGESLDMDRHISTQRPARELVLRQVRGEDDDDFGESFALDDSKESLLHTAIPERRAAPNVSHLLSITDDNTEVDEDEDFPKATASEAVSASS
jgi:hypothetical protein